MLETVVKLNPNFNTHVRKNPLVTSKRCEDTLFKYNIHPSPLPPTTPNRSRQRYKKNPDPNHKKKHFFWPKKKPFLIHPEKYLKNYQPYDYYLCFDVEATCERGKFMEFPNEIIEFPVVLLDGATFRVVDEFHAYVRPTKNPVLSQFCIELTGISQCVVDVSPTFEEVLALFGIWLMERGLFIEYSCAFITDGPFDIRDFIEKQCRQSKILRPIYFWQPWIDIRRMFSEYYGCERKNIPGMLEKLSMKFRGREHSGIDDARNIGRIAKKMVDDGCMFTANASLMTPYFWKRKMCV
ncbi:hypothetical protein K7432_001045 [Basidiobolus ranarum]|uniref:Exonuclease domain-containing protein n=1 Tax=Basidiobolus ranarum TaxID=34480 RepID=A0ABR2X3L6_9FUNG